MRWFVSFCLGTYLVFKAEAQAPVITGSIDADATWSQEVLLRGNVVVASGVLLAIEPGTRVLMDSGATLRVRGKILALGTETAPVWFTRAKEGVRWKGIRLEGSVGHRFEHCVFEYADSEGTHLDYADDDCNAATPTPARIYHEAVVILAGEAAFHWCQFRNLPDAGGTGEGDAIAVIGDDPENPGPAGAEVVGCRFERIGQGIHSRFASLRVENSSFSGHNGNNFDIDIYGDGKTPPILRQNRFELPMVGAVIGVTRSSAVLVGNRIEGSPDHGIVLRDRGSPVLINNLISGCQAGAISVQNQCDALVVNNTIWDCGLGLRLFDQSSGWGAPDCLPRGGGRAIVINTILWDCLIPIQLRDSPSEDEVGSRLTVTYSVVERGQAGIDRAPRSSLGWGEGNLALDPRLGLDGRPEAGSPAIDMGTNAAGSILRQFSAVDIEGTARLLDGNGDGVARVDMGAHERLLASADSNQDGIPDGWAQQFGFSPVDDSVAASNPDSDPSTTLEEWRADTHPLDPASFFQITQRTAGGGAIEFLTSTNRRYSVEYTSNLAAPNWSVLPGQNAIPGDGQKRAVSEERLAEVLFYRVRVELP